MSLILALDSSTDACSAALLLDDRLVSRFEIATKSHTQRLLPMVDELLTQEQLGLQDLDALAFGRGPGSFTGLRICMGVVQGLAFGSGLPVVPVSTLEAMAMAYARANPDYRGALVPALDARMGEVYWAEWHQGPDLQLIAGAAEAVTSPTHVAQQLADRPSAERVALGTGWSYPELAKLSVSVRQLESCPRAEDIALLAARRFALGEQLPIAQVQPVYLRDSVSWQKRQRIRTQPLDI